MKAGITLLFAWFALSLTVSADGLRLASSHWIQGAPIPTEQIAIGCGGKNRSPAFAWSGAPPTTRSYAVTLFDADAAHGRGFWHWVLFDLASSIDRLPTGASTTALPAGSKQTRNDYGGSGYGGPCPPAGMTHHYILTVFALDVERLPISPSDAPEKVAALVTKHAVAKASITARFGR